jgi:predicted nuclease of restriction endonuclease-like (RecB) superfamily
METPILQNTNYKGLVRTIAQTIEQGRNAATRAVNTQLLQTYWQIGQYIVEYEQKGSDRATYGKSLIDNLAKDLSQLHGKGFSHSNLIYMRLLYIKFSISEMASHLLRILKLAQQGHIVEHPSDLIREPYIVEFLKIQNLTIPAKVTSKHVLSTICNTFYSNSKKVLFLLVVSTV